MSEASSVPWPAAMEAASFVTDGMVVGLGTGRAAAMFVRSLAERVRSGLEVRGVPTSVETERLAKELAIPLAGLEEIERVDIDVDGADEVAPDLSLIKGHGGALVRERVVASLAERFVILVGEEKLVPRLGARVSVPVEIVPFAAPVVRRRLEATGAHVVLRSNGDGIFVSDNGNHILDARFERIDSPSELERSIDAIPGVVDNGIFVGMASEVLVQTNEGVRSMTRSL